jgi:hypothetical protein
MHPKGSYSPSNDSKIALCHPSKAKRIVIKRLFRCREQTLKPDLHFGMGGNTMSSYYCIGIVFSITTHGSVFAIWNRRNHYIDILNCQPNLKSSICVVSSEVKALFSKQ